MLWEHGAEGSNPSSPTNFIIADSFRIPVMTKKKDHSQLLCGFAELTGLFADVSTLENFLKRTVEMVAEHMQADVCSIYLYQEDTGELVLKATKGLKQGAVGTVRLKMGEGLTGLAVKEMRFICERDASANLAYKYFPEIGEERYPSFLAVPLLRGQTRIGALVIQNSTKNYFTETDVNACKAIASQLVNTLEMTKVLAGLQEARQKESPSVPPAGEIKFIKARVGAEGFAMAPAVVFERDTCLLKMPLSPEDDAVSLEDFDEAVRTTAHQLEKAQKQIEEKLGDVASLIFAAQLLMLKDEEFLRSITVRAGEGTPVRQAIVHTVKKYVSMFESLPNEYLKEKKYDVLDIGVRLLENLNGGQRQDASYRERIVIAQQLYPSEILKLYAQEVKGIVLLSGGVTSHLSILAGSLEIPLLITDEDWLLRIQPCTVLCIDGEHGHIFVNPDKDVQQTLFQKEADRRQLSETAPRAGDQTATKDGERIFLLANINLLSDVKTAQAYKAEGIGLYRTEFPFIIRSSLPTEEEQFVIYKKLVDSMTEKEITFRTLDIGGDKVLSYYCYAREENPFLGMRSIRFFPAPQRDFSSAVKGDPESGDGSSAADYVPDDLVRRRIPGSQSGSDTGY